MKNVLTGPTDGTNYHQVTREYDPEEDVESDAVPKKEKEPIHMGESSETTRLLISNDEDAIINCMGQGIRKSFERLTK